MDVYQPAPASRDDFQPCSGCDRCARCHDARAQAQSLLGRGWSRLRTFQNVSSDDRSMASTSLSSAAGLLNEHKNDLSGNQKHAIAQINAVSVTASSKALLGEIGRTMRLSTGYIKSVSIPWLASIFGHEGQHLLDKGQYSGSNLWLGERSAGLTQLGIGRRIGYSQAEIDYLQGWVDIRNRDAMQQHVEQGYSQ